jgi:outer membrane receptor protein involved in Fe transport
VLQPSFLRGFTLTADWYNIRISKAINQVTAEKVAELCVDQATLDNQYCDAITRNNGGPNAGFIDSFVVGPLNVAAFTTAGLDVSLNYIFRTDRAGTFSVNVVGNYLDKQSYVPIPGAAPVNDAYTGGTADGDTISPKYQAKVDLTWKKGALTFNYGLSWWSKTYRYDRQRIASNPDIVAPQYLKYKERWVQDVYLSYDFDERLQLYTGIDNIGNQKPAIGSSAYPVSAVGRFFYVGAKVKLADAF